MKTLLVALIPLLCGVAARPSPQPSAYPTENPTSFPAPVPTSNLGFDKHPSIAFAILGSMAAFYFMFQYVINGRFHQLAFYRRHLLERMATYCRVVHTLYDQYLHNKKYLAEQEKQRALATHGENPKKVGLFLVLSFLILSAGTLFHFLLSILQIMFDSLLIYKGFYREGIDVPIGTLLSTIVLELAVAMQGLWIHTLLSPFTNLLLLLCNISLDLGKFGVHCNGMKLPAMLFLNVLVVGIVIIVVESNVVVFEIITLRKTFGRAFKAALEPAFAEDFSLSDTQYYLRLFGAGAVLVLVNGGFSVGCLKIAMSSVNFNPFFSNTWRNSDLELHKYCDDSMNLDSYAAYWAIFLAAIAVPAFIYSTVKFLVPVTIFEEGMHPHEVLASKHMFQRLWSSLCGATATKGHKQMRIDEVRSYRTEDEKYAAKERTDTYAAKLGLLFSYLSPDLWITKLVQEVINLYFTTLRALQPPDEIYLQATDKQNLDSKNSAKVFEVACGASKDQNVMDGWEKHYRLRLPSLYNFLSRQGVEMRLKKALRLMTDHAADLVAGRWASCRARHPAYAATVPVKDNSKKEKQVKAVVLDTRDGMRHKVKPIDRGVGITSGRQSADPPLSNLLNSDALFSWTVPSREQAWIELNLGQARIVTGYSLRRAEGGDPDSEPTAWTVFGKLLDPGRVTMAKTFFLGKHPLDMTADNVQESDAWVVLHEFSEGEAGHFDHITHKMQGRLAEAFDKRGMGRSVFESREAQRSSLFGIEIGKSDPNKDWELFELVSPVAVTHLRIVFTGTRGVFSKGVSIAHLHVYLDKDVSQGTWLFSEVWRYLRIVFQNYFVFITACLGIWENTWAIAFEMTKPNQHKEVPNISEQFEVDASALHPATAREDDLESLFSIDSTAPGFKRAGSNESGADGAMKRKRDQNILGVMQGIIGARAVLFQAIPGLSFLTVWVTRTVDCPLYVKDAHMRHHLPRFLITWGEALAEIKAEKPELPHVVALLLAPKHCCDNSRSIKFALGLCQFLCAISLLYGENRLAVMFAVSVLLIPVSLVQCMALVAELADLMHIRTDDLNAALGIRLAAAANGEGDPSPKPAVLQPAAAARQESLLQCSQPSWKRKSSSSSSSSTSRDPSPGFKLSRHRRQSEHWRDRDNDSGNGSVCSGMSAQSGHSQPNRQGNADANRRGSGDGSVASNASGRIAMKMIAAAEKRGGQEGRPSTSAKTTSWQNFVERSSQDFQPSRRSSSSSANQRDSFGAVNPMVAMPSSSSLRPQTLGRQSTNPNHNPSPSPSSGDNPPRRLSLTGTQSQSRSRRPSGQI